MGRSLSLRTTLLLLAAVAPLAAPREGSAQAWLESLKRVHTDHYELYAPTDEDLAQARRELDHAVRQFELHFGAKPPRIAVVLRDENPPGGYADAPFRHRGLPLLAWITDRGWEAQHAGPEWAGSGRRPHSESHILPHEACHKFMRAYVDQKMGRSAVGAPEPRTRTPHYGHPDVADWFDEASAMVCEHADERATRRARLRAGLEDRLPLAEIFAMSHPFARGFQVRSPPAATAPAQRPSTPAAAGEAAPMPTPGTPVGAMTFRGGSQGGYDPKRAAAFVGQSLSVAEFIVEHAGPGALGRVADGLSAGRPITEVLAGLGLAADPAAFERQWLDWVRERP